MTMSNLDSTIGEYQPDQWWVEELKTIRGHAQPLSMDQYRAINIARMFVRDAFALLSREQAARASAWDTPARTDGDADWPTFKVLARDRGWSIAEASKAWEGWKAHRELVARDSVKPSEGWQLVPSEATQKMADAAYLYARDSKAMTWFGCWRAMLAASPTPEGEQT